MSCAAGAHLGARTRRRSVRAGVAKAATARVCQVTRYRRSGYALPRVARPRPVPAQRKSCDSDAAEDGFVAGKAEAEVGSSVLLKRLAQPKQQSALAAPFPRSSAAEQCQDPGRSQFQRAPSRAAGANALSRLDALLHRSSGQNQRHQGAPDAANESERSQGRGSQWRKRGSEQRTCPAANRRRCETAGSPPSRQVAQAHSAATIAVTVKSLSTRYSASTARKALECPRAPSDSATSPVGWCACERKQRGRHGVSRRDSKLRNAG